MIKAIIVEDDPVSAIILKKLINDFCPEIECLGIFSSEQGSEKNDDLYCLNSWAFRHYPVIFHFDL